MYLFRVSTWHLLFANIFLVLNIAATIALPVTVNDSELSVPPSSAVTQHSTGKHLPPTVTGHGRRRRPRPGVKLNFNQLQQYKLCLSRLKWDKDNRQYVRILESDQRLVDADPNEIWSMMFLPVVWEGHGQNGYYSLSYRTKVSEVSTEHMMGPLYQWGPNTNGERISLDDYPKLLVLGTVTMTLNLKRDVMEDVNTAVTENRINELPNLLSLFQYQSLIKKELDDRSRDPVRSSSIRGIAFDLSRYQVLHKRMLEEMGTAAGSIIAETMLWEWYLYRSILARQLDIAQSLDDKNRDILLHMDHLYDPKVWPSQTSASSSKNPENGLSHRT